MKSKNQNEIMQRNKDQLKKYWFEVMERREKDKLKVQKFRLIMAASCITLLIISVFTGKFEQFMNYLINLILSFTK